MSAGFYRLAQGLRLSSVGIGTYLGDADDATDARYEEALREALTGGITVIDTSRNYRAERSERVIGRAIAGWDREELVLCTKAGYEIGRRGHSLAPDFLEQNLAASRDNLGVDRVDVFYLHNPETQTEGFEEQVRLAFVRCEEMAARGWLRFYGVATWDAFRREQEPVALARLVDLAREVAGARHRFRFVQFPFNLGMLEAFTRRNQPGAVSPLRAAADLGLTAIGSATVYQGRLTRNLPAALAAKLGPLATDAQRAIQFSRSTPGVTVSLVGMASAAHVRENLALREVAPLSEKDYYAIYAR